MKNEFINRFEHEILAEIGLKVDQRLPKTETNSIWAQQRPSLSQRNCGGGPQITLLEDMIAVGRQAVGRFLSCPKRLLANRKEQSGRCESPGIYFWDLSTSISVAKSESWSEAGSVFGVPPGCPGVDVSGEPRFQLPISLGSKRAGLSSKLARKPAFYALIVF